MHSPMDVSAKVDLWELIAASAFLGAPMTAATSTSAR
jgi:hypothetical protein